MPATRRLSPAVPAGLTLAALFAAGCNSAARPAPQPMTAANRPLAAAEPPPSKNPAAESPADALARRVEAFARSLETSPTGPGEANSAAMSPASSPDTAAPAGDGQPAAVVRVSRDEAATSVVKPLSAATPPAGDPVAAVPKPAMPPGDWNDLSPTNPPSTPTPLEQIVDHRLRERPTSAANVLDYELIRLLDGGAGPELAAASTDAAVPVTSGDLAGEDQRILGVVRDGLSRFRRTLRQGETNGPAPLPSEKIGPLVEMARALRREVGLTLPAVALCSEVKLFGNYEPLPTTFEAGQSHLAILYVEVDGFASREATSGEWETKMALSATLYDPEGKPVLTLPEAQAVDRSRGRRRDFYLCSYLTLPAETRPGPHTLKVTVRDEISRKIAQQSLKLTFVAK